MSTREGFDPILLDLDGTVVDSVVLIRESHRHAVREVLGEDWPDDRLVANVGRPLQEQMQVFSPQHSDELYRVYREWNHANTSALLLAYDGVEEALRELRDAGLGSLPGGGAEVFADRVRRLVAPGKEHPDNWFDVHRTAHRLGIPTHCTILYGHVETYEERVDHLLRLRELQDETGGFLAFIPLAFHPENTVFERRGWKHTAGSDDLKMIAVSRLLLDNVPNVKAYWIMMGLPLTQVALHFGANDVQGTVVREEIFHAAGARTETEQKVDELARVIQEAGRIPVQRDTLYNQIRRW